MYNELMEKYLNVLGVLVDVLYEMDNNEGHVEAPTYLKLREVLGETCPIPNEMKKKIERWEEIYDCKL